MKRNLYIEPSTGDLTLLNYNLRLTNTMQQFLSQKIENTLKTINGEFFANERIGIPYFQQVFGKSIDLNSVSSIFKSAVLNIPEVDSILKFETEYDPRTRIFEIDYTVKAVDDTVINGTLEV